MITRSESKPAEIGNNEKSDERQETHEKHIPDEIVLNIFKYSSLTELSKASRVNRQFYRTAMSSKLSLFQIVEAYIDEEFIPINQQFNKAIEKFLSRINPLESLNEVKKLIQEAEKLERKLNIGTSLIDCIITFYELCTDRDIYLPTSRSRQIQALIIKLIQIDHSGLDTPILSKQDTSYELHKKIVDAKKKGISLTPFQLAEDNKHIHPFMYQLLKTYCRKLEEPAVNLPALKC